MFTINSSTNNTQIRNKHQHFHRLPKAKLFTLLNISVGKDDVSLFDVVCTGGSTEQPAVDMMGV